MRLAHRVAELENLPHGLSEKKRVLKVRTVATTPSRGLQQPGFRSRCSHYNSVTERFCEL